MFPPSGDSALMEVEAGSGERLLGLEPPERIIEGFNERLDVPAGPAQAVELISGLPRLPACEAPEELARPH